MGSTVAAAFMLMLGIHGPNGVASLTTMASFPNKAECQTAATAAKSALGAAADPNIGFVCLSSDDLQAVFQKSGAR